MKTIDRIKKYWPIKKYFILSLLKRNRPYFGLFFQITSRCNANCAMCFNWQKLNQNLNELSLEEIENFSKTMGPIASLSLGGGEPFLREDLPQICQIFTKNNRVKKIAIPTNSLLTDRVISSTQEILSSCPVKLKIVLSLDGVGEIHDKIRGVNGAFAKFQETYKKLNELCDQYPQLQLNVNTTISNKNEDNILEILNYVNQNLQITHHTLELIRGSFNSNNIGLPSLAKCREIKNIILANNQALNQNKLQKKMYAYFYDLSLKILAKKKQLLPCRISSFLPVIDEVGNVYHCEILPSIGNLRDYNYDFFKIWDAEKAKQQRKAISQKKCYCTHYCYQIQNIPLSPWHFCKTVLFK